jgi:hypothetical protein
VPTNDPRAISRCSKVVIPRCYPLLRFLNLANLMDRSRAGRTLVLTSQLHVLPRDPPARRVGIRSRRRKSEMHRGVNQTVVAS